MGLNVIARPNWGFARSIRESRLNTLGSRWLLVGNPRATRSFSQKTTI